MPLGLIALFTSLLFFPMPGVGIVGKCCAYSLRGEFDSENRKLEKTPVNAHLETSCCQCCRYYRAGGGPVFRNLVNSRAYWIPAFAGMTGKRVFGGAAPGFSPRELGIEAIVGLLGLLGLLGLW